MRLDKYLKNSRLIKRRTIAKEFSDAGRVLINGKVAKSASSVTTGDVLELTYGSKIIEVKVLSTPEIVKKEDSLDMYEIISEKKRPKNNLEDNNLDDLRNF
ncbi:MAG: RNA-binding S4 domain-containing protein [Lactobacillaceae bacterium]|jgi:ribosomal 50S subunit-recycling heat shock protein|nr:RNA-binding S4 domain-containing protein [Lactobacillaceae bacterium]